MPLTSKMSSAGIVMAEFGAGAVPDVQLQSTSQDADYVRLGHSEEDDQEMDEFELAVPDGKYRRRRLLWWSKVSIASLVLIAAVAAFVYWAVPFILEKVLIPILIWETSTFSKPVLVLVLVLSLAIFPIFLLPSGPSMLLCGMIFGYGYGFLIIMVGSFFGQTLPYFIGRWLLHDKIQEFLVKWPKQAAVLRIAEQGSWVYQLRSIAILRLSPLPYAFFNYAIAGTNITFGPYIAGSMAVLVPESFITIYSGKMLKDLADLTKDKLPLTWPRVIYFIVCFSVAIALAVGITVLGRRALAELEIREAAEREENERQMQGVVDDVENEIEGRGLKRTSSWSGVIDSNFSPMWGTIKRTMSFDP